MKKATHWILLDSNETEDFQLNDYEYKKLKSGDTLTIFIVNKSDLNEKNNTIKDSCKILEKTYFDWSLYYNNDYHYVYYGE